MTTSANDTIGVLEHYCYYLFFTSENFRPCTISAQARLGIGRWRWICPGLVEASSTILALLREIAGDGGIIIERIVPKKLDGSGTR